MVQGPETMRIMHAWLAYGDTIRTLFHAFSLYISCFVSPQRRIRIPKPRILAVIPGAPAAMEAIIKPFGLNP
jgi:hypothetical protein